MHRDFAIQWQIAMSRLGRARKGIFKRFYLFMILYTFGYACNYVPVVDDHGKRSPFGTAITAVCIGAAWPLYWSYRLQNPSNAR